MVRSSYRPLSRDQMRAIAGNPQYAPPPEAVRQGFNRTMYAGQDVAAGLGGMMGGTVRTSQATGGIDLPEHGLQFSNGEGNAPSEVLNAGLLQDRIARGVGRGENPDYINASIRDQIIAPPGPRVSEFGVQPTSGAMTSADAERMYAGDPRFDPNVRKQLREVPNYRMGAGGANHGPSGIDDDPRAPMPQQAPQRMIPQIDPRMAMRERTSGVMSGGGIAAPRQQPLTTEEIQAGREFQESLRRGREETARRMGWNDSSEDQMAYANPQARYGNMLRGGGMAERGGGMTAGSSGMPVRGGSMSTGIAGGGSGFTASDRPGMPQRPNAAPALGGPRTAMRMSLSQRSARTPGMGTPGMSNPRGTMGSRPTSW